MEAGLGAPTGEWSQPNRTLLIIPPGKQVEAGCIQAGGRGSPASVPEVKGLSAMAGPSSIFIPLWDTVTGDNNRASFTGLLGGSERCCAVAELCLTLCDRMDCSMPGLPILHYLPESTQTHVR